jgi:hypothetical protein
MLGAGFFCASRTLACRLQKMFGKHLFAWYAVLLTLHSWTIFHKYHEHWRNNTLDYVEKASFRSTGVLLASGKRICAGTA